MTLSPPVKQNGFAGFVLEEINFEKVKLQFGGRVEHVQYKLKGPSIRPHLESESELEEVFLPNREFNGFSGSVGLRAGLWDEGAFVAHVTSSFRAPSPEELYNYGPHVGNLSFEIGNPYLLGERSNGFDLSLRHSGDRMRMEGNFFFYDIGDFIFGAPTGEIEHGLFEIKYDQGNSRFVGAEFGLDVGVHEYVWLATALDVVDAQLTESNTPLPRIPPLRAKVGVDLRFDGLSFNPELVLASGQNQIFPTETETEGYQVVNLKASYTYPQQHFVHHFAFEIFNVSDKLYRNHVSFIKDLAPEMGRGVRFSYALKLF